MPLENKSATLTRRVTETDLASSHADVADEHYPKVLSSPAMLSLMERACAELLKDELGDEQLSVGVKTKFDHRAPTALGQMYSATATFIKQEGGLFLFDVSASDASGAIGGGTHARAIVHREAIEDRAAQRSAFLDRNREREQ
ncbi:thioesterase family protein [Caballeronia sordidicola]|uniref:thioesterase family protein n=1 Tax=Caballeronia sordidicola TaxID=196367 RepID=UPI0004CFF8C7|nr:hotdog domain-containing protein [Caballeronia sordidicola]